MPAPLHKLGITALNEMQRETGRSIRGGADVVLRSPTGTGKTLAFLLPLLEGLRADTGEIQALVLAPTRELAQQIEQVARTLGSGHKVNAVYGGRAGSLDKLDLRHRPALLIGTPGRVADRFRRDDYSLRHIRTLVLDEYDKSLEIGFATDMAAIIRQLPALRVALSHAGPRGRQRIQFPITVTTADGTDVTVEDRAGLRALRQACR